mmetsp:Transcript_22902/g.74131  ORF Transcript_22902/g.74131 Transcript_22902/m.74131 type:complete len:270 (-) Transcript_22902:1273-2082(-)
MRRGGARPRRGPRRTRCSGWRSSARRMRLRRLRRRPRRRHRRRRPMERSTRPRRSGCEQRGTASKPKRRPRCRRSCAAAWSGGVQRRWQRAQTPRSPRCCSSSVRGAATPAGSACGLSWWRRAGRRRWHGAAACLALAKARSRTAACSWRLTAWSTCTRRGANPSAFRSPPLPRWSHSPIRHAGGCACARATTTSSTPAQRSAGPRGCTACRTTCARPSPTTGNRRSTCWQPPAGCRPPASRLPPRPGRPRARRPRQPLGRRPPSRAAK